MKKLLLFIFVVLSVSFAQHNFYKHYTDMTNPENLVNPDGYFEYMIVKGDYLSFLADRYYGDPLKWTKIHKANPYIVDPNWIYPSNWLVIPSLYADEFGKPTTNFDSGSLTIRGVAIDLDGDGIIDGVDLDGDGVIDANAGIDLNGDGVIDGYDMNGDGIIDLLVGTSVVTNVTQIDLDGNGVIDGYDLDGDGVIDAKTGIDFDGDGTIDGYDVDGDGNIDLLAGTAVTVAATQIDLDGDGIVDGYDLDGDGVIDANAGIDLNGDGVIDGYDLDGDGNIDLLAGATAAAVTTAAMTDDKSNEVMTGDESSVKSYCGKPGWKLGLHAGYPTGGGPDGENLNMGALLGTPLGVKFGPVSVGLGAGAFTYDFDKFYFGAGLLASLCINELLQVDMPVILQIHGTGFYIFGEGPGLGAIGSATIPFGKSPFSLGLYGAAGKYYPEDNDYNWSNIGGVLFYNF